MMATCSNVVRGGATLYFVKYVMDHPEMATQFLPPRQPATMFGSLCSSRLLGPFLTASPPLSGSSPIPLISLLIFTPAEHIARFSPSNIPFLFVLNTTTPLQWLMALTWWITRRAAADAAPDGLVFSTYLFSLRKIGPGIGGAVVG